MELEGARWRPWIAPRRSASKGLKKELTVLEALHGANSLEVGIASDRTGRGWAVRTLIRHG
jgi:hypothetical protein